MKTILACERSGGHIFPAIAVGKSLKSLDNGNSIIFFSTSRFLKTHIEKEGFEVIGRSFGRRNILIESFWRFFEALIILFKVRPQRIIGFGGRDSFFLMLFAQVFGVKTIIYEPNLKFGRANKVLSFLVDEIWRGFKGETKNPKTKVIGIPLRENIKIIDKKKAREKLGLSDKLTLFCFGGSQGAAFINDLFIKFLRESDLDFQALHLTGRTQDFKIRQIYNTIEKEALWKDFSYDIEFFYNSADIVICRAGAITLGEISFYGLPSVLIPHPKGMGHQRENALYFKKKGAALIHEQFNLSWQGFKKDLEKLISDKDSRDQMAIAAKNIKLGVSFENFCNKPLT